MHTHTQPSMKLLINTRIHAQIFTYACIHINIYICMHTYTRIACVENMFRHTNIHTHKHTHTHTHTFTQVEMESQIVRLCNSDFGQMNGGSKFRRLNYSQKKKWAVQTMGKTDAELRDVSIMCVYMYTYIHVYVYIYIYIYIHTYTITCTFILGETFMQTDCKTDRKRDNLYSH
jgi:hypothetical protein